MRFTSKTYSQTTQPLVTNKRHYKTVFSHKQETLQHKTSLQSQRTGTPTQDSLKSQTRGTPTKDSSVTNKRHSNTRQSSVTNKRHSNTRQVFSHKQETLQHKTSLQSQTRDTPTQDKFSVTNKRPSNTRQPQIWHIPCSVTVLRFFQMHAHSLTHAHASVFTHFTKTLREAVHWEIKQINV